MTRDDHPSGTDRVAEVAANFPDAQIIVNLQGDEPEIAPDAPRTGIVDAALKKACVTLAATPARR